MMKIMQLRSLLLSCLIIGIGNMAGPPISAQAEPPAATDAYEFPVQPGTPEWSALDSTKARIKALQPKIVSFGN